MKTTSRRNRVIDGIKADRERAARNGEYSADERGDAREGGPPSPKTSVPVTPADTFPDPPRPEAYHGLAGDFVRLLEPHTEADPVAILVQTLVAFGSVIGRTAYFEADGVRHYLNLYGVIVGQTAKARKGTSWSRPRQLFGDVDPAWADSCIQHGLSSAEGLIWAVRDPIQTRSLTREKGRAPRYETVESDPGIADKRCLVQEAEFCSVLKQFERQGNTLSAILRQAWETGKLKSMTKNSPAHATGAHISIVGHITAEELRRYLTSTEAASGLGNRFLWLVVRRSKLLPDGGGHIDLEAITKRFSDAVSFARAVACMPRDDAARELWHEVYPTLSGDRLGLAGSLLARAEAQTMRLACVYALLDCSYHVEEQHLKAALALWDYCERSTKYIFGNSTGDPMADEILDALRHRPNGMSRTEISELFSRNKSGERLARALNLLATAGLAEPRMVPTDGRSAERWFATKGTK